MFKIKEFTGKNGSDAAVANSYLNMYKMYQIHNKENFPLPGYMYICMGMTIIYIVHVHVHMYTGVTKSISKTGAITNVKGLKNLPKGTNKFLMQ